MARHDSAEMTEYDKQQAKSGNPDYRAAMDARELGDRAAEALRLENGRGRTR